MTFNLFLKVGAIWFIIALLAIVNGLFRESILVPYFGQSIALPSSAIILSIVIFIVTYISFQLFENNSSLTYIFIGMQWVSMTLIFEFIFGHYVVGKTWSELLHIFNIAEGNLFIIVLLMSLFSPILVAKLTDS